MHLSPLFLCKCTLPWPYMQASVLSRQIIVLINVELCIPEDDFCIYI
jgi:hypothetical protein